jgi:hypothetical protein
MSFYINMEQTGDVAVLQCVGRIVRAEALSLLKDAATSLFRGDRVLVLGEYAEHATASVGRRAALDRDRNPCLLSVGPPTQSSRVHNGLI